MKHPFQTALMLIRLTTLGAARVHRGETALADLPAQRLRFALLLYLAVERDVSREEVVAMFWPDRDTGRGKHALRQMLYELRQVLGDEWIDLRRDRIVVDAVVDATEFERAVEAGRSDEAISLYGGAFLLGFSLDNRSFEAWVDRRGGHLARLHRKLQRDHINGLVSADRSDDALVAARHWVELDPLDDEAAHTLIARFAASGLRNDALQFYDNYERQLAAELQVEPLEETRALIAAIRSGDALPADIIAPAHSAAASSPDRGRSDVAVISAEPGLAAEPVPAASARTAGGASNDARSVGVNAGRASRETRRSVRDLWRAAPLTLRAAAVILLVVAAGTAFLARPPAGETVAAVPTTVAVLPLHDNSSDGSLASLATLLTEDLARALVRSPTLSVISPNGARRKLEEGATQDSLGRLLGAAYLVGGSITRYEDQVRVDIELIDGRTGQLVRSEAFDRPWSESLNLGTDIVLGAAMFLHSVLGTRIEIDDLATRGSSQEAFELMVRAQTIQDDIVTLLRAHQFPKAMENLVRADSLLEVAASIDTKWVEPVIRRGWVFERRAFLSRAAGVERRRVLYDSALVMARLAAQREPDNARVHTLRGMIFHQLAVIGPHLDSVAFANAEAELNRAAELDPTDQDTWRRLTDLLLFAGRYGEAKVAAENAYRIDPFSPAIRAITYQRFMIDFETGRDEGAHGWCSSGSRLFKGDLAYVYCALALYAWSDLPDPSVKVAREIVRRFEQGDVRNQPELRPRFETMIAAIHARAGQADSARAILRRTADARDPGLLWMRAAVHAELGEDSTALALLDEWMQTAPPGAERVMQSRPFWRLHERTKVRSNPDAGGVAR